MINVTVSDNEVKFTLSGDTYMSREKHIIRLFKECKTDRERSELAVNLSVDGSFERIPTKRQRTERVSTLDILEGRAHEARKQTACDHDEADDLLGPDPYIPLY